MSRKSITFFSPFLHFIPINLLIKISKQKFIMPFYHTVSNEYLPHINNLYSIKSTQEFVKSIDYILRHYKPITLHDLLDNLSIGKEPDYKSFVLSFDDGLSQFYDIAAPILLKKGIHATCFLNSKFIDNKDLFFRYKASLLIEEYRKIKKTKALENLIKNRFAEKKLVYSNFKNSVLNINYNKRDILDQLAVLLEFSFTDFLKNTKPYMSKKQIETLIGEGFTFGSHSIDNPEYGQLELNEQLHQTDVSMKYLLNLFHLNYKAFSFPFTDFGIKNTFFESVKSKHIVDISFGCAGLKNDPCNFNFQRIPMEDTPKNAALRLKFEYFYYIVKSFLNKNNIFR